MALASFAMTTWSDIERNCSRLGYRHHVSVCRQLRDLRSIFMDNALVPYISSLPGMPALILVKGPLFRQEEIRGKPVVEFVVTLTHDFPNSFPIITVEQPPRGYVIQPHRNVNAEGCCFLPTVSSWSPMTSTLSGCVKELYRCFKDDYPFCPISGHVPQDVIPHVIPSHLIGLGSLVNSVLSGNRIRPQPPGSQPPGLQPQVRTYDYNRGDFDSMLLGASKPMGTVINTPDGFGLSRIVAGRDSQSSMTLGCPPPPPLPPVQDPTPDEQYRIAVASARNRQAEPARGGRISCALKKLTNFTEDASHFVEDKIREKVKSSDEARFRKMFTNLSNEQLITDYVVKTLVGDGTVRKGHLFITNRGIHFSSQPDTEPPAGTPRPIVHRYSVSLTDVVSLVIGNVRRTPWLHAVCSDGSFRSFFDVESDWISSIGSLASRSLEQTPYHRLYNWLDHAWRSATADPRQGQYTGVNHSQGQESLLPPSQTPQNDGGMYSENTCCICLERPKNCFFLPCGHVCVCMSCSAACAECPLCRSRLTDKFQAFL